MKESNTLSKKHWKITEFIDQQSNSDNIAQN
jgi:hypothetical protein